MYFLVYTMLAREEIVLWTMYRIQIHAIYFEVISMCYTLKKEFTQIFAYIQKM
jgi:hypothetical protein